MKKNCPTHGPSEVVISNDPAWYERVTSSEVRYEKPGSISKKSRAGCPFDCGFCDAHKQRMVLPVVPVTSACNLNCPVCYTINKNTRPYFITREEFKKILAQIQEADPDMRLINFTGGEPLMHPEFTELVKMCRDAGIHRITISTNGLGFLENETLLERLTELDARIVFSFNSFQRAPYIATAGKDLLEEKLKILGLLEKHKPSTTLLSVVALGINDQEIGDIVAYVMGSDFIVSSEIHTVAFTGQNVGRFAQTTRLTTPDVIAGIVKKNPDMAMDDFLPSPCAHPLCYAVCYLLKTENNGSVPFARFMKDEDIARILTHSLYMQPDLATEEVMNDVLNDVWSRELSGEQEALIIRQMRSMLEEIYPAKPIDYMTRQRRAEQFIKAVYIHSHMDAANFDVQRAKRCCVAVPDGNGRCIPTCAYNNIYRARDTRFCDIPRRAD
jgi:uncharacterized radical SAM superfamily Fe-S cluster-containing enzyme